MNRVKKLVPAPSSCSYWNSSDSDKQCDLPLQKCHPQDCGLVRFSAISSVIGSSGREVGLRTCGLCHQQCHWIKWDWETCGTSNIATTEGHSSLSNIALPESDCCVSPLRYWGTVLQSKRLVHDGGNWHCTALALTWCSLVGCKPDMPAVLVKGLSRSCRLCVSCSCERREQVVFESGECKPL